MKNLYLVLAVVSLLVCAACGSGGGGGGVPGFIPKGNFTNASLTGQYVYQIQGFDFSNATAPVAYSEAGVFTANGSGVITNATDDFSEGTGVANTVSTGSYAISNDGTGSVSFNNALGTINLEVTLVSASKVYMVEADSSLNAGGLAEKQDPTAIAAAPGGTFVFLEHDVNPVQSVASVGAYTVTSGVVSNGNKDVNGGGTLSSATFVGSFNPPDPTTGRGSGTFTDNSPATSSFNYYVVDANNVRFLSTNINVIGQGRAELQSGTPALSGSYAFGSKGDTSATLGGVNMAGRFSASGGTVTAGARDSVQDGGTATNVAFTGTFTAAASGRTVISLTTAANSNLVVWMVNPTRGLFLVNDPTTVQDGSLDLQQTAGFTNSTMNGQFGFVMEGFDTGGAKDRVGTLQWDGSGKLILNEFTNAAGTPNTAVLSGNYAVSSNGRTGASISNLSSNLIFYLISGNDAYVVQNDSNVEMNGTISKQQ